VTKVLVIEDDEVQATAMRRHLTEAGFVVEWVADGEKALRRVRFERPDVCVLDLMIPGMDGWNVLEAMRAEGDHTPVVVLSARSAEHDRVHLLEAGADDFLVKPASMRELVARVRAAARRGSGGGAPEGASAAEGSLEFDGLRLDPNLRTAFVVGDDGTWRNASLTVKEFQVLRTLAGQPNKVFTRDDLQQRVWGIPHRPRDRSVDVCVRKLRSKIELAGRIYIHTHYGVGYRFAATPEDASPTS
jgi:DNA-binding response OmpR family regulator